MPKSRYKPTKNESLSPLKTKPLYQNEERTVLASTLVLEPLKMELHPILCLNFKGELWFENPQRKARDQA
jgi:hypothetical protein